MKRKNNNNAYKRIYKASDTQSDFPTIWNAMPSPFPRSYPPPLAISPSFILNMTSHGVE